MAEKLTKKASLSCPFPPAQPVLEYIGTCLVELDSGFGNDDDLFRAGLDSMGIMNLLLFIEEKYDLTIPLSALTKENFSSVNSIARLIVGLQNESENSLRK